MTKQFRLYQSSVIWLTCFLLAEVVNWLHHALQIGLGQAPPTTPSPNQSQSATFDLMSSVFNLCTATCSRNMGNEGYTLSPAAQ